MSFSEDQQATLTLINQIGGSLSLVGSIFVVGCYIKLTAIRSFAFKLVLYMSIATLFLSCSAIIGETQNPAWCKVQAVLMSYFELAALCWAGLIAFVLHMAFLLGKETFKVSHVPMYHGHFLAAGWGFPLVLTILPATTDSYGEAGGWCWIIDDSAVDIMWRFIQFYVPLWIIMIYCGYVYYKVAEKFKESEGADAAPIRRLKMYPLVLVICYFWATINRVFQAVSGGQTVFFLSVLQIAFSSPIGFINALIYGYTRQVRTQLKGLCTGDLEAEYV